MPNRNSDSSERRPRGTAKPRRDTVRSVERLIAGAFASFAEHGYRAASIHDICAQAGVGIGTFYAHYEHKRELLREVMLARAPLISRLLVAADFHDRATLVVQLRALVDDPMAIGLWRGWHEAVFEEPEIARFHARWRGAALTDLVATVADARTRWPAKGPVLDASIVAWTMATLARDVAIQDRAGAPTVEQLADLFQELVFGAKPRG